MRAGCQRGPPPAQPPQGVARRALRDRAADARYQLESLSDRADRAIRRTVESRRHRLSRLAAGLEALSPLRVLARGYSLTTRDRDNLLIRRAGRPSTRRAGRHAIRRGECRQPCRGSERILMNADEPEVPFEDALERLERIVNDLQRGELDLAASLASYEKGVALLARCQALLDGVDRSVALLTGVEADGTPVVTPFDASATAPRRMARRRRPPAGSASRRSVYTDSPASAGLGRPRNRFRRTRSWPRSR